MGPLSLHEAPYLVHATPDENDLLPSITKLAIKVGEDGLSLSGVPWPFLIVDGGPPIPFVPQLEMLTSM